MSSTSVQGPLSHFSNVFISLKDQIFTYEIKRLKGNAVISWKAGTIISFFSTGKDKWLLK